MDNESIKEDKNSKGDFFDWSKDHIRGKNTRNDTIAMWIFIIIVLILGITMVIMINTSKR
ncbi:hypothetical protein [Pedobacter cryoconitis]|uniref:Uncharacterized protein n=1 Tax=Pedobacter cryoconitis TaxID=188932 RepID=A0A327SKQ2_9SPHI|nr:hypothetical protein [Pedobacter cryoconitis]RAJ29569.1 hypothetical protein LY11_02832 [Pedobacter cryoconitis]